MAAPAKTTTPAEITAPAQPTAHAQAASLASTKPPAYDVFRCGDSRSDDSGCEDSRSKNSCSKNTCSNDSCCDFPYDDPRYDDGNSTDCAVTLMTSASFVGIIFGIIIELRSLTNELPTTTTATIHSAPLQ